MCVDRENLYYCEVQMVSEVGFGGEGIVWGRIRYKLYPFRPKRVYIGQFGVKI